MLALQRALESRRESDWMGRTTAGIGGYPPINIFQQGNEFVAVIELPGVDKRDLQIEAKEKTIRISGTKAVSYDGKVSVHRREPCPASSIARYRCRCRSMRTASELNIAMAY